MTSRQIDVKASPPDADLDCMETPAEIHESAFEVQIETFRPDDVEAIAELVRGCSARPDEAIGSAAWGDASVLAEELESWAVPATETLYVARAGGRVIGFCGVETYPHDSIGLIHGPVVEPESRQRGVGRALFEVSLRTGARRGATELWAAAGRDNRRAQSVLGDSGFDRDEVCALFQLDRTGHTPLPAPMDVRRASSADLPSVLALAEALGSDLHMTFEELADALLDPAWHVWVAGGASIRTIVVIDPHDRWIRALATREDARRRGLGATVLSAALDGWWRENPDLPLGLTVRAESLAVVTQYHRLGFEPRLVIARYSRR
ncbi:MAG TPA: GNAT family N-acetyltransferase [Gaiellales bacterium]